MPTFQAWSGKVLGTFVPKSVEELHSKVVEWFPDIEPPLFRYFDLDHKYSIGIYDWKTFQGDASKVVTVVPIPSHLVRQFGYLALSIFPHDLKKKLMCSFPHPHVATSYLLWNTYSEQTYKSLYALYGLSMLFSETGCRGPLSTFFFKLWNDFDTIVRLGKLKTMAEFFRFSPQFAAISQSIYDMYYRAHDSSDAKLENATTLGSYCVVCDVRHEGGDVTLEPPSKERVKETFKVFESQLETYWNGIEEENNRVREESE